MSTGIRNGVMFDGRLYSNAESTLLQMALADYGVFLSAHKLQGDDVYSVTGFANYSNGKSRNVSVMDSCIWFCIATVAMAFDAMRADGYLTKKEKTEKGKTNE